MKKISTVITAFLICAAFFASTKQFDQVEAARVEPHEVCLEELACDELCQEDLDAADQILVANKNPLVKWVCTTCGQRQQRAKSAGRPNPGKCPRKKNGGGHSWARD